MRLSKLLSIAVLTLSSLAALSSTSSAVAWTNSGATSFTATAGAFNYTVTSVFGETCTNSTATGTAAMASVGIAPIITGTLTFSGCLLTPSRSALTQDCGYGFTGVVYDGTGIVGGAVTGGFDITCSVYSFGTQVCKLEGATAATYFNGNPGVLTVPTTRSVTVTNVNGCPIPTGELGAMFLSPLRFSVTSGTSPTYTRDA